MSGAITRVGAARSGTVRRQLAWAVTPGPDPCTSTTGAPSPACTTLVRMPPASMFSPTSASTTSPTTAVEDELDDEVLEHLQLHQLDRDRAARVGPLQLQPRRAVDEPHRNRRRRVEPAEGEREARVVDPVVETDAL